MAEESKEEMRHIPSGEQTRFKQLMEKDSRAYRSPKGFFKGLISALSAGMVLFYFYTAGLATVATQYHRGVYVFVTFVLVFLMYPAGKTYMRLPLSVIAAGILAFTICGIGFFANPDAFHAELINGNLGVIGPLVFLAVVGGFGLFSVDRWFDQKWPQNPTVTDILFALASAAVVSYWIHEFEVLNYRAGAETNLDAMISIVGIILSLEVCRRVLGWSMTFIGLGLFLYGYLGPYFPEVIAHRGFGIERLCTFLYLTTNGVFGIMANVLATYVILFIFFGAFLHKSGAGKFFIDLPLAIAGRTTGGPAKVAVIASALFGSVSGSAIANTVSTGAFTIPLMKRAGFRPHVAGAIEPAASIGGMFLPPIMGAGGFLMAELTETSYSYIMMIAVFPALLYFFSVFLMIHFEAKKQGLQGVTDDSIPHWKAVFRKDWYFSLPLIIITILMIMGKSPGFAAFWSALSCIGVSWIRPETRMGPKEIWEAIQTGARNTLIIGATLGVIGIIVGTISLTGIGLKFSDIIISLAGGNLLLAIVLIALASLVLGMGVPVTAAYLIVAVLAVPPLVQMGVPLLCAHMIVYWFSQDSNITPPVCVAAYAGAAIAGSDPWKTGWTSFKFAKLLYVMPILFAFTPSILFQAKPVLIKAPIFDDMPFASVLTIDVERGDHVVKGDLLARIEVGDQVVDVKAKRESEITNIIAFEGGLVDSAELIVEGEVMSSPAKVVSSFSSAVLGTIAFSSLTMVFWLRRTSLLETLILIPATILLYWPTLITDAIGIGLVTIVLISQLRKVKTDKANPAAA